MRSSILDSNLSSPLSSPSFNTNNTSNTTSATTLTTDAAIDSQKSILNSQDPALLKKELEKAFEIVRQQELEVKKLKFELEMERGHVNILRHDNQMLRQKTVNMVIN